MTGTAGKPWRSGVYVGRVTHRRLKPVDHRLEYRVFSFLIDLDELSGLDARLRHFSRGRLNLFSFHDRDHAQGAPQDLAAHIRTALAAHGIDGAGPLELLCYPRMLGYVFNPLSVYFCHDRRGAPSAVIYEVSSTFGERHSYLIPLPSGAIAAGGVIRQQAKKRLHVSPFMAMDMTYDFRVRRPAEEATLLIRQRDPAGPILNAAFQGKRRELTDAALRGLWVSHPLMTMKVVAGIHWEAAKLLGKGLKLRAGDKAPEFPMTLVAA